MLDNIPSIASISFDSPQTHLLLISLLFLLVWWKSLFNDAFLIDDVDGIAKYSDKYDSKKHQVLDGYKQKIEKDGKTTYRTFKNTQFNPLPGFPGCVIRWIRLNIGKKFKIIGKNAKGHDVYGYVQSTFRHHLFSLTVFYIDLILAYFALSQLFSPQIAFLAVFLFCVHPVACQAVAWISGIGYLTSLLGVLATLITVLYIDSLYITMPLVILFTALSAFSLLAGAHVWAVLLVLGQYPESIVALFVAVGIMYRQWGSVVMYRSKAFEDQNMGESTKFTFNRIIIMFKTLFYYFTFVMFPMKLGLFHTYGYHQDEKLRMVDWRFWAGFLSLIGVGFAFYHCDLHIRFGIVWFLFFVATFLNAITAMQFVVDRYIFIPSLGFCVIAAYLLQDLLPLYFFLVGFWAMRCIIHIPTFKSEIDFYLSNSNPNNFYNNEVALGNLGVVYMNKGMPGSACDVWMRATKINKFYDVPWYNLYSMFKSNGMLEQAREYLKNCLNSRTVHFENHWKKEMDHLNQLIASKNGFKEKLRNINASIIGDKK